MLSAAFNFASMMLLTSNKQKELKIKITHNKTNSVFHKPVTIADVGFMKWDPKYNFLQ